VDEDGDDTDHTLAGCVQLSLAAPQRITPPTAPPRPLEVSAFGMSLHAATVIDGRDRKRLERMCRYLLRPPFAHDAMVELPDGRVRLSFKSPTRSGATHVDLEPHRFLARLVGLVPPPRQHQVRHFGIFSNHHALRSRIQIELANPVPVAATQVPLFDATGLQPWRTSSLSEPAPRARARLGWASLLARVFSLDISVCSRCGGLRSVIAAITDADEIARVLHGARPPPRSPLAGQLSFFNA
jgi:Putative transposase